MTKYQKQHLLDRVNQIRAHLDSGDTAAIPTDILMLEAEIDTMATDDAPHFKWDNDHIYVNQGAGTGASPAVHPFHLVNDTGYHVCACGRSVPKGGYCQH